MNDVVDGVIKAVRIGRTDIVRSVIAACQTEVPSEGFDISTLLNSPLTENGSLLHLACKLDKPDIVRLLLSTGADTCVQNEDNKTPLELSPSCAVRQVFNDQLLQGIAHSNVGQVCQLLAAGVSVNLRDSATNQNTPLHWAACYGNQEVIDCLCNRGADVNAVNSSSATPLHDAVLRGPLSIVDELLKHGASASLLISANHESKYGGKTPLELAVGVSTEIHKTLEMASQRTTGDASDVKNPSSNGDVIHEGLTDEDTASTTPHVPCDLNHHDSHPSNKHNHVNGGTPSSPEDNKSDQGGNDVLQSQTSIPQSPLTPLPDLATLSLADDKSAPFGGQGAPLEGNPCLEYLWPRPQKLIERNGQPFVAQGSLLVCVYSGSQPATFRKSLSVWRTHEESLRRIGLELQLETLTNDTAIVTSHVSCDVNRAMFNQEESYRISVSQSQVKIQCSDLQGLHCAIRTLIQLLTFSQPHGIPPVQIHDHPSLSCRGVLLDMSKGRILQTDFMKDFLRILFQLKINQLQLYFRFCVPDEPELHWQFPYTRSVLLELAHLCETHCVELVPVLDIASQVTLDDLDDLYITFQQYISCFTTAKSVSVGPRLTSLLTDITEEDTLSLEDAHRFVPLQCHQTLQLCAYVFHEASQVLPQVPCNTVLAEYGFQSDHDFADHCSLYEEHGVPYCVVAGSAAWNSLAGCPEAAVANIHNATQNAISHNAAGLLVSHWSGVSHVTHHSMIWPGILAAAGLAWNSSLDKEFIGNRVAELMNKHVYGGRSAVLGQVVVELGRAETYLLKCGRNQPGSDWSNLPAEKGSTLYQLLTVPDKIDIEHLTVDQFQRSMRHIRKCQSELSKASLADSACANTVAESACAHSTNELAVTMDLMMTACRLGRQLVSMGRKPHSMPNSMPGLAVINPGIAHLSPTTKTDLANRLLSHMDMYRNVWLATNLPQGLQDSLGVLSHILKEFIPNEKVPV